jgi:hypothetical protein
MGDDGDPLHDWKFGAKTETDVAIVDVRSVLDRSGPDWEADVRRGLRSRGATRPMPEHQFRRPANSSRRCPARLSQPATNRNAFSRNSRSALLLVRAMAAR